MKKFKTISKYICGILAVIMISTLVSGCSLKSNTSTAPQTFVIWGFDDEDVWKPYIGEVQTQFLKGYDIKYVKKTLNDSYENDSLNSIMSGQGPDLWVIPSDWVYRHKDKLAPLPDALAKELKINIDQQYVPAVKTSVSFDGKIYGLTPTLETLLIYYNPKLFQAAADDYIIGHPNASEEEKSAALKLLGSPPITWTDFVECVKLLNKKNGNDIIRSGVAMGTSNNIKVSSDLLSLLMMQRGAKMVSDNVDMATFNLPDQKNELSGKNALDFYASFANPNSPQYSWNSSMPSDIESFVQGKTAMIFAYPAIENYFAQLFPNFKDFQGFNMPQIGENNESVIDYGKFNAMVTPKLSPNTNLAWQFINYMSNPVANSYSNTTRIAQSVKRTDLKPSLRDRGGSALGDQTQTAQGWIKGRYPLNTDNALRSAIDSVNTGNQDSKTAIDTAANTITNLLREDTW